MSRSKESTIRANGAKAATLGISLAALLLSCSNILTGNDMKKAIGTDVAAANAPNVAITVQPDATTNGGTTQPLGQTTVKVGIPFDLTTTVGSAFVFGSWTQIGGNGEVTFQSATSATTTATLTKNVSGIVIQANYIARPAVSSTDPFNGTSGVGINKSIKIVFSTPIEVSSLKNNIVVTTVNYSDLGNVAPTDISSNFSVSNIGLSGTANPTVTGVLLSPTKNMSVTQYIQVTCKKAICDASGNLMASDYPFTFITGSSIVPPPTITSFAITKADGTALGSPDFALNSTTIGLTLGVALSTAGQSVIDTQVVETALTSAGAPTGSPVTTDLHTYSGSAMPYTLKTSGQGYKLIQVQVEDNYFQLTTILGSSTNLANGSSVFDTYKILYDSSSAAVSGLTINGGNQYTKSGAITLGFTLSKSATPAAVLTGYMIKDSATTPTAPLIGDSGWTTISGGPTSYTGSAIAYTLATFGNTATSNVYVYVKDEAGNIGNANAAIIGDNVPPAVVTGTVSFATTGNSGYVKNGQTVSIAFTMLEATSGLNAGSPSVKIGGQSATISGTYPNFTASLALAGTTVTEGMLGYTIDATDNAGNAMTEIVGSTGIVYNRTAPTFAAGTIATSGNTGYAKTGNTITVPFTATETGSGFASGSPSATIDGQTATVSGTYPNYVASYTFAGSEPETTAGYAINGTDKAGNAGSLSGSTNILYDHTAPTFAVGTITTSGNAGYAKSGETITVNFTATETGSGFASGSPSATIDGKIAIVTGTYPSYTASYTFTGSEPETTAGYVINGIDKAGNVGSLSGSTGILVDHTAPMISALTISSSHSGYGAWATTGDTITLAITSSDTGSGLNGASATIAGKTAVVGTGSATYVLTYTLVSGDGVADGVASYSVTVTDKAGNSTTVATTTDSSKVTVDRTGPVANPLTIASNHSGYTTWATNGDTITLNYTLTDAVSVNSESATIAGVSTNATATNASYTLTSANTVLDGTVVFSLVLADVLGNTNTISAVTSGSPVTIDRTAPTASSLTIASNHLSYPTWATNGDKITLTYTLVTGAVAIGSESATIAGGSSTDASSTSADYTLVSGNGVADGTVAFSLVVTDVLGNSRTISAVTSGSPVTIDRTAPTVSSLTIASNHSGYTTWATNGDKIMLTYTLVTGAVAIGSESATIAGGSSTDASSTSADYTLVSGNGVADGTVAFSLVVTDVLGNSRTISAVTSGSPVTIDRTAPTASSLTIASNHSGYTTWATNGDKITLTYALVAGAVAIGGESATIAGGSSTDASSTSADYTLVSGNGVADGTVAFSLVVTDVLGNGRTISAVTSGSPVTIDRTAPTASSLTIASDHLSYPTWATDGDKITLTYALVAGAVAISGESATIAGGSSTDASSTSADYTLVSGNGVADGTVAFSLVVTDVLGNSRTISAVTSGSPVTIDRTAPTASSLTIASNHLSYPTWATNGDKITLTYTLSSAAGVGSESATIAGGSSTDASSTSADYTLVSGNGVADGTVAFSLVVTDVLGNSRTISAVTSGSPVTIDRTAPTASSLTIASDHLSYPTWATDGDKITLTYALVAGAVAISGESATIAGGSSADASSTSADYTLVSGNGVADGTVAFSLVVTDVLGNSRTISAVTSGSPVTIDRTAPTASSLTIASNHLSYPTWATDGDKITLTYALVAGAVAISGESATIAGGSSTDASSTSADYTLVSGNGVADGTVAFSLVVTDVLGNSRTISAVTSGSPVTIDRTAPTASSLTIASNHLSYPTWATNGDKITLTYILSSAAGVGSESATIAGESSTDASSTSADYTLVSGNGVADGTVAFSLVVTDVLGNSRTISAVTSGSPVTIDRTAPTASSLTIASNHLSYPTWATNGDKITLTYTLSSAAGVGSESATIAGGSSTDASSTSAGYTLVSGNGVADGTVAFSLVVTDVLGNSRTISAVTSGSPVTIDRTAPTASSLTIASDHLSYPTWATDGDKITLTYALVAGAVAISGESATIAGGSSTDASLTSADYTLVSGNGVADGTVAFSLVVTDVLGNSRTISAVTSGSPVTIDRTAPTASSLTIASNHLSYPTWATNGDKITLTYILSSAAGVGSESATIAGGSSTDASSTSADYTLVSGNGVADGTVAFSLVVTDVLGNSRTISAVTSGSPVTIDRTAPTASSLTIASNHSGYTTWATNGDKITLTYTLSSAAGVGSESATIAGGSSTDASSTSADYTLVSGNGVADGTVAFSLVVTDVLGNSRTISAVTSGSPVTIDRTAPTASSLTIASNHLSYPTWATDGDKITLTYALVAGAVAIGGESATIAGGSSTDASSTSADYTLVSGNGVADGTVAFSLVVTDVLGNSRTISAVTSGSPVTIDRTAPTASSLTIASDHLSYPTWATDGDKITLTYALVAGAVAIGGESATIAGGSSTDASSTSADYTLVSGNGVADGTVAFSLVVTDVLGNSRTISAVTSGSPVTIDRTAPTASSLTIASNHLSYPTWATNGDKITLTYTLSSAAGVGSESATIAGGSSTDASLTSADYTLVSGNGVADGTVAFSLVVTDVLGNSRTISAVTGGSPVTIDRTAPTASSLTIASNHSGYTTWATNGDKITLTYALVAGAVAIGGESATIAGGSSTDASSTSADYTLVSGNGVADGTVAFSLVVTDVLGNSRTISAVTSGSPVTIDRTAPTASSLTIASDHLSYPTWATNGDKITLTYTLSSAAGVGSESATIAGGSSTDASSTSADYTLVSGNGVADGTVAFSLVVTDVLGNSRTISAVTSGSPVTIDRTAPTASSLTIASNHLSYPTWATNGDKITLTYALVAGAVAIGGESATIAGGSSTDASSTSADYTLVSGNGVADGTVAFSLVVTDVLGNSRTISAVTSGSPVTIDRTAPTASSLTIASNHLSYPTWATNGDKITLTYTLSSVAGVGSESATIAGGSSTDASSTSADYTLVSGNGVADGTVAFSLVVTDVLGNSRTISAVTSGSPVTIDRTAPTASSLTIVSNHLSYPTWATDGDKITLTYALVAGAVAISGESATIAGGSSTDASSTSADYTLVSGNGVADGTVAFSLVVTDVLGNSRTISAVTSGSPVTIDRTAPLINSVSSTGNDPYALTIDFTESGSGVVQIVYTGATNGSNISTTTISANTSGSYTDSGVGVPNHGYSNPTGQFSFTLIDALGHTSNPYTTTWNSTTYKSISPSSGSSRLNAGSSSPVISTVSLRNPSSSTSRPIFTDPVFSTTYSGQAMPRPDEIAAASKLRSDIVMEPISMRYASTVAAQAGLNRSVDTSGLSILQRSASSAAASTGKTKAADAAKSAAQSVPAQTVRYTQTSTASEPRPAETTQQTAQGSSAQAMGGAAQSAAPAIQARLAAPNTTPSPAGQKTPAPADNSVPKPDFCLGQARERRDEDADTSEYEE